MDCTPDNILRDESLGSMDDVPICEYLRLRSSKESEPHAKVNDEPNNMNDQLNDILKLVHEIHSKVISLG